MYSITARYLHQDSRYVSFSRDEQISLWNQGEIWYVNSVSKKHIFITVFYIDLILTFCLVGQVVHEVETVSIEEAQQVNMSLLGNVIQQQVYHIINMTHYLEMIDF